MFPSTKPSLYKETKGRYSKFVIWILLVTVASIVIASAFVAKADEHTDNNAGIASLVHNDWGDVSKNSRFDDESLAKKDDLVVCKNTEEGTIDIDWLFCDDLPLCITQDVLDSWGTVLVAKIKGGYEPIGGIVDLSQGNDVWYWKHTDLPDLEIVWEYGYHSILVLAHRRSVLPNCLPDISHHVFRSVCLWGGALHSTRRQEALYCEQHQSDVV